MRQTLTINGQAFLTPTFIGIGAPKCATTWISHVLRGHPEVFVSNPKELRYFAGENWRNKHAEWYLGFFEKSGQFKAAGEFTTNYMVDPASADRIYDFLGDIKIIVSIRNPVDRFISHFKQKVRNGSLPQQEYRVLTLDVYDQVVEAAPILLASGEYNQGILTYFNIFGEDNVMVLLQEDIKRDAAGEFGRLCDFLAIERFVDPKMLNRTVLKGTMPKYRTLDRSGRKFTKTMDRFSPQLVNFLRQTGLVGYVRQLNARTKSQEIVVEDSVRKEIGLFYQADVAKLEELLGRDLHWNLE